MAVILRGWHGRERERHRREQRQHRIAQARARNMSRLDAPRAIKVASVAQAIGIIAALIFLAYFAHALWVLGS